jgi:hypothetical protein
LDDDRVELPNRSQQTEHDFTHSFADATSQPTYSYEPDSTEFEVEQVLGDLPVEITPVSPHVVSHDDPIIAGDHAEEFSIPDMGSDDWRHTLELFDSHFHTTTLGYSHSQNTLRGVDEPLSHPSANLDEVARFHEVLKESYAIAAPLAPAETERHIVAHQPHVAMSVAPESFANVTPPPIPGGFQEEEVLDRYASIDAGFEPPAIRQTDTVAPVEVHHEHIHAEHLRFDRPVASVPFPPPVPVSEFQAREEIEELVTPPEGTFTVFANGPVEEHRSFEHVEPSDTVNSVEGKFVLGQPVRESTLSNSSSDSLLQSIRKEVDDLTSTVGQKSGSFSMSDELMDSPWESVETPPAEPKPDVRPFRYLFSKLRRKQQGLS